MADRIKNYQQEADQITTLKAIRTDLGVTPSSYTPDATVVTKDRVVTFAQAEEELAVLGDIEKGVKQQVTEVDIAQKDIANIKALLQGNLYDYQTDSTSAYTKSVPAGAMPYAGLEKVGGKTLVWNQLFTSTQTTETVNGVTCTVNADGSVHIQGTASDDTDFLSFTLPAKSGHKIYLTAPIGCSSSTYHWYHSDTGNRYEATGIYTNTWVGGWAFRVLSGTEIDVTFYPQWIDLTALVGRGGSVPSTVEELKAILPADWYAYNPFSLLSAGVTQVLSKDSSDNILQTVNVPAEIQALDGYGWGIAGSVYNYIDYERKVFVKRVGRVVYNGNADESWTRYKSGTHATTFFRNISGKKKGNANLMCSNGYTVLTSAAWNSYNYLECSGNSTNSEINCTTPNASIDTVADWKAWLQSNPLTVHYELNTPVETDISEYLTDDNLIEVESGGTLTFPNQNGTDYRLPVPSEETYMIDLQEALS